MILDLVSGFDKMTRKVPSSTSSLYMVADLNPANVEEKTAKNDVIPPVTTTMVAPYNSVASNLSVLKVMYGKHPPKNPAIKIEAPRMTHVDADFKYLIIVYL